MLATYLPILYCTKLGRYVYTCNGNTKKRIGDTKSSAATAELQELSSTYLGRYVYLLGTYLVGTQYLGIGQTCCTWVHRYLGPGLTATRPSVEILSVDRFHGRSKENLRFLKF